VKEPKYLGDAVYIQEGGDQPGEFILTTGSHKQCDSQQVIFLEEEVVDKLIVYIQSVREERKEENQQKSSHFQEADYPLPQYHKGNLYQTLMMMEEIERKKSLCQIILQS
jgi:hypothetical protein